MKYIYKILLILIGAIVISQKVSAQCQTITTTVTSTPAMNAERIVEICKGTTVQFSGSATFATSSAGAAYDWSINNVPGFSSTTSLSYTFVDSGVYVIDFIPTDAEGCTAIDCNSRVIVHVSGKPNFFGTAVPDSICVNSSVSVGPTGTTGFLVGVANGREMRYDCAPPVSTVTFLPDGSGLSFTTSIEVSCYTPCDTIRTINDINAICVDMEHSYSGDLSMRIVCPTGQQVQLKNSGSGGSAIIGEPVAIGLPVDDASLTLLDPGIGYEYCFSPAATGLFTDAGNQVNVSPYTDPLGNVSTGAVNQLQPGTFNSQNAWTPLIGCPLNGVWTIHITDHAGADNGYVFGWSITFNRDEDQYAFENTYPTQYWTGPDIISPGNPAIIEPKTEGVQCYQFNVVDDFGCAYDTVLCTFVKELPNPGEDSSVKLCPNIGFVNMFDFLGGTPELGGFWTGPGVAPDGFVNIDGMPAATYRYVYTVRNTFCEDSSIVLVEIYNDFNVSFAFDIDPGCQGDTVHFTNTTDSAIVNFRWNYGDGSPHQTSVENPSHVYEDQGVYSVWFIATNENGCVDSIMQLVNTSHPLEANFTMSSDSVCQYTENTIEFRDISVGNIISWHWDFGDGHTSDLQNPSHTYTTPGTHVVRLIVTEDKILCTDTMTQLVYVDPTPTLSFKLDRDSICTGEFVTIALTKSKNTNNITWDFGDGSVVDILDETFRHAYPETGSYIIEAVANYPVCPNQQYVDTIFVKPYPKINLHSDTGLCLHGAPIYMDPSIETGNPDHTTYYWSTGDSASILKIVAPGTYRVAANLDGCITEDEFIVHKDCYVDIPNSFTPNDDGSNDYFFPRQLLSKGVIDFSMTIYNRWGEKVFETTNPNGRGWDGTMNGEDQPSGVYVYVISVRYKNQAAEKYTGNVTLLR